MLTIDEFKAQDIFRERMLREYKQLERVSDPVYAPYFEWKEGRRGGISRQEAWAIRERVEDDLDYLYRKYPHAAADATATPIWGMYEGFGGDKYLVSYLEAVDEEIGNFLVSIV